MGIFDRVILTLYTFSLAFVSLGALLLALGWSKPMEGVQEVLLSSSGRVVLGMVATIFFGVSVRLLWFAFRRPQRYRAVVHQGDLGEVRITLEAVENLVQRVARGVQGVREVKPAVARGERGLEVYLRLWVAPDVNIPRLADLLRQEIRRYVEDVVGVEVVQVDLSVENITSENRRARVE
ncbi:MAG: alkaline shock response membrane anchor protein AmaP [Bacillota bacterium]|nr:alkaline shock response membrane anchor protein AmaP [Bacillota bacterium]